MPPCHGEENSQTAGGLVGSKNSTYRAENLTLCGRSEVRRPLAQRCPSGPGKKRLPLPAAPALRAGGYRGLPTVAHSPPRPFRERAGGGVLFAAGAGCRRGQGENLVIHRKK